MARKRDRRGRYLKRGSSRNAPKRRPSGHGRRRRNRRARSSNAPRRHRRHRRHNAPRHRMGRSRTRTVTQIRYRNRPRRHRKHRGHRSNPPYTIKTVLIGAVSVTVGFLGAKHIPAMLAKATGRATLSMGWEGVGVSAGVTLGLSLLGYALGRALATKRTAMMVAVELAVGGTLATGAEAYSVWKMPKAAPPQAAGPAKPALVPVPGVGLMTPAQIAGAQNAARVLGMGNLLTPQDFAHAGAATFGRETTF